MSYAIASRVSEKPLHVIRTAGVVFAASIVLAIAAHIRIPLPFTPVPISLHNSLAVLMGIWFGRKTAFLAVLAYLFYGTVGLPVFTGGHCGFAWLFGPTGGYLLGFAVGAYVSGFVADYKREGELTGRRVLAALVLGHLVVYSFGVIVLAQYVGWSRVWVMGVFPFLPGCVLKLLAFSSTFPKAVRLRLAV